MDASMSYESVEEGRHRPNRFTATTLAVFWTGVGLLYAGRPLRGALWIIGIFAWPMAASLLLSRCDARWTRIAAVLVLVGGTVALWLAGVVDAWRTASAGSAHRRRYFQRLPVIAVVVVAYMALAFMTRDAFLGNSSMFHARATGASMTPTILDGERFVVRRHSFKPTHGVIVYYAPPDAPRRRYIGRIVALPGDDIESVDGQLFISGSEERLEGYGLGRGLHAEEVRYLTTIEELPFEEVEDDCVFILGDNRRNSRDSRHFGCVPLHHLHGTVEWWLIRRGNDGGIDWRWTGRDVQPKDSDR
jgi:signal peptidase I